MKIPIPQSSVATLEAMPTPDQLKIAKRLEKSFLQEVLKMSGVAKVSSEFGGGIGEEQFNSFLLEHYAEAVVEKRGLGLTEHFLRSLN